MPAFDGVSNYRRKRRSWPFAGDLLKIFAQPSITLIAAGASGFFTLIQSGERPDR
jgi:hypothetical protein